METAQGIQEKCIKIQNVPPVSYRRGIPLLTVRAQPCKCPNFFNPHQCYTKPAAPAESSTSLFHLLAVPRHTPTVRKHSSHWPPPTSPLRCTQGGLTPEHGLGKAAQLLCKPWCGFPSPGSLRAQPYLQGWHLHSDLTQPPRRELHHQAQWFSESSLQARSDRKNDLLPPLSHSFDFVTFFASWSA